MLIGHQKEHVVDAVLLHDVDSDILGEAREVWDTVDIMVRYIVRHRYHLHAGIIKGGERYNFSSYPIFIKDTTIIT